MEFKGDKKKYIRYNFEIEVGKLVGILNIRDNIISVRPNFYF